MIPAIIANGLDSVSKQLIQTVEDRHSLIDRMEAMLINLPAAEIETLHHFAPGVYGREMRAKAGTLITGKEHKGSCINVLSQGRITVFDAVGDLKELTAPHTFISGPGTRRAGYVHDDVIWTSFFATDETDPVKLEALLAYESKNPLIAAGQTQPLK